MGGGNVAKTLKEKYGEDYFSRLGKAGGKRTYELGHLNKVNFHSNPDLAKEAGRKGGLKPKSEETRRKMREAWKRRKNNV